MSQEGITLQPSMGTLTSKIIALKSNPLNTNRPHTKPRTTNQTNTEYRTNMAQWSQGVYSYAAPKSGLKRKLQQWHRTITGSTSLRTSSSVSSDDAPMRYSVVHMVTTASIATAAASPTAVSSAGLSPTSSRPSASTIWNSLESESLVAATMAPGSPIDIRSIGSSSDSSTRRSMSSTIRNFLHESTSSLTSINRPNRWSTSAVLELRMDDLQEENDNRPDEATTMHCKVPDMMEPPSSYGANHGGYTNMAAQVQVPNYLCVPGRLPRESELRLKTSFQSFSTIESVVSGAGSWDEVPEAYSPSTDMGYEDDGGSRHMSGKTSFHNTRLSEKGNNDTAESSPTQDSIIAQAGFRAWNPLYRLTQVPELLDKVLGYLNPSDITNLQLVCKTCVNILRHSEVYHTLIYQKYHHIPLGLGNIHTARAYEDLKRVVKQDRAIKDGRLSLLTQLSIPVHTPRVRYQSGYACFNQASGLWNQGKDSYQILVHNLRHGVKDPMVYSTESKIVSIALGGGARSGVHLVYCEVDQNLHASISCYLLPSRDKKWEAAFPPDLVLSDVDRVITQTNGLITVVAVKDRIIAWNEHGRQIGDNVLPLQQANFEAKKGGQLYLSNNYIYLATWGARENTSITAYCSSTLELKMHQGLNISGSVGQVTGLFSGGKLYLAIALHTLSNLCSIWRLFCVDDKCPSTVVRVEDFPNFNEFPHSNLVYYPDHGLAYIISHSNFQCRSPTNNLSVVNIRTGREKRLQEKHGYLSDLVIDGDCFTGAPLQGDNEFLIWCTKGKMEVYRFDYDNYEREREQNDFHFPSFSA